MDDKNIIALFFERSERAIEETARKYGKYCYTIAKNILGNHEDSEETVNDTYNDVWNSIPPHEPNVLSAFIGKITRRISIDRWRTKNAEKRGSGNVPLALEEIAECIPHKSTVEAEFDKTLLEEVLREFTDLLPETERKIFILRYWYLDSVKDISKNLGFSESKVKSILFRTRNKLRQKLEKEGF